MGAAVETVAAQQCGLGAAREAAVRLRQSGLFSDAQLADRLDALSTVTPAEVGGHADAQTEARAIMGDTIAMYHPELLDRIATALAAKDAGLAKFDFEKHSLKVSLARAERAALAEARKALEEIGNGCDGRIDKDALPCRIARRALTGGQEDG